MSVDRGGMHLAVALDGAGFHPAAWRHPTARPEELFRARYWADLARTAERGLVDFLTLEDAFGLQAGAGPGPDARTDQVRGRLDAVLVASMVAPLTRHVGLVPTAVPTHTEPFHLASAFATLDYVSKGRAGWRPQVSGRPADAAHVGRHAVRPTVDLFEEAADAVEVVRRLWDSWEDDAVIRDVTTGRFVDRDRLHYVDFEGRFFSVKGPSIVPRPPQGNPLVAALAHVGVAYEFAARSADVVFVTPADRADVGRRVAAVRAAEAATGRAGRPLVVLADLVVYLAPTTAEAEAHQRRLDDWHGAAFRSDAATFAGPPADLADLLVSWRADGLDGFRLRPAVLPHDLDAVVDEVVPALQHRGAFRPAYQAGTLRERLGLGRPVSRYATEGAR